MVLSLYTVYLCVYFRSYTCMQPNGGINRRLRFYKSVTLMKNKWNLSLLAISNQIQVPVAFF